MLSRHRGTLRFLLRTGPVASGRMPGALRRADAPSDTIGSMSDRYITASELKSFDFCRRAWFLERQGAESTLVSERARGQADHESHGHVVQQANLGRRTATLLFVLGLAGIGAAALLWWFAR